MDKALKQRLVGATVLIALAVIVLPMLLSGPASDGTPQSQKIELPAHPDVVDFETRRFPLGESPDTRPVATGEQPATGRLPLPAAVDGPAVDPEPEPAVASAELDRASGEDIVPAPSDAGTQQVTEAAVDQARIPAPDVEVEPAPSVVVRAPETSRTDGGRSGGPADSSAGRYVVQVASLGSDANARKLVSSLQEGGLDVLLDTVDSDVGRLSRVRVGPYATEAEANDAVATIRSILDGVNPRVVDLRPDEAAPVTSPGDPLVRWVVQVGSFSDASNADGLVDRLRADGMSAYGETVTSGSAPIHRVRVGPFLDREDALAARQRLIAAHSLEGVVMSAD